MSRIALPSTLRRAVVRAQDLVLGVDAFVSYRHADGKAYAAALQRKLEEAGWRVWRDDGELEVGDELGRALSWALHRARMLVLIASPRSCEECWMHRERREFRARRPERPIVAIDVGGAMQHAIWSDLVETLQLPERPEHLLAGDPHPDLVERLRRARTAQLRNRLASALLALVAVLLVGLSIYLAVALDDARDQRDEALRQRHHSIALYLAREAQDQQGDLALLLAAQAHRFDEKFAGPYCRQVYDALRSIYERPFRVRTLEPAPTREVRGGVAASLDGRWLLFGLAEDRPELLERTAPFTQRFVAVGTSLDAAAIAHAFFIGTRPTMPWAEFARAIPALQDVAGWRELFAAHLGAPVSDARVATGARGLVWVALLADGRVLASAGAGSAVVELVRDGLQHEPPRIEVSADGRQAFVARRASTSSDDLEPPVVVEVFDLQSSAAPAPRRLYEARPFECLDGLLVSPNGRVLACYGSSAESSATVLLLDVDSRSAPAEVRILGETVASIEFDREGDWLAVGSRRWGIDGEPRRTQVGVVDVHAQLRGDPRDELSDQGFTLDYATVKALRFSPDGTALAAADGRSVRVWRFGGWQQRIWSSAFAAEQHAAEVSALAWTSDASLVSVDTAGAILEWDLDATRARQKRVRGPDLQPIAIESAFAITRVRGRGSLFVAVDGRLMEIEPAPVVAGRSRLWAPMVLTKARTIVDTTDFSTLRCVAADAAEAHVAVGTTGGAIGVVDIDRDTVRWIGAATGEVVSVAIEDAAGRVFALDEQGRLSIHALDAASEAPAIHVETTQARALAAHPSGTWVASVDAQGRLERWSALGGASHALLTTVADADLRQLAFDHDGDVLALGDARGRVHILKAAALRTVAATHLAPVGALTFSPDGRFLAVGAIDGWIAIHDLSRAARPIEFDSGEPPITGLAFSNDGTQLLSTSRWTSTRGGEAGGELLGHLTLSGLVELAQSDAWRNLTDQPDGGEWSRFVAPDLPYEATFDPARVERNGR